MLIFYPYCAPLPTFYLKDSLQILKLSKTTHTHIFILYIVYPLSPFVHKPACQILCRLGKYVYIRGLFVNQTYLI